ncbi:MAG: Uncharacterised protein [Crocinitomicaceae bacterium]|nr:MAG: Uncharacterised protein [Crocinitomicaceae bacterium]
MEVLKKFTSKEAQPSLTDAIKSISDTPDKTVSILILFWQLLLSVIVSVGLNVPLSLYVWDTLFELAPKDPSPKSI